jgi:internalin A
MGAAYRCVFRPRLDLVVTFAFSIQTQGDSMTSFMGCRAFWGLIPLSVAIVVLPLLSACGRAVRSDARLLQMRATPSFLSSCKDAEPKLETRVTVKALLARAGTEDCDEANSRLMQLFELDLQNESISDLGPLSSFTSLDKLYLSNNRIVDLSPLASMQKLRTLWVSNNDVGLETLPRLASLVDLSIARNQIRDLTPLAAGASRLQVLSASQNDIEELGPLRSLTQLQRIIISSNRIASLSPLSSLSALRVLEFTNNSVNDLVPLVALKGLNVVIGGKNRISDLSPLRGLSALQAIALWGNSITSLSPLADVPNLALLNVRNNSVASLTPLRSLAKITTLSVRDNPISKDECPQDALSRAVADVCASLN